MINRLQETLSKDDVLAKRVIGLAMEVHNTLGVGLVESLYVNALIIELQQAGIPYEQEKRFVVSYKGTEIGYFMADLVVDSRLIVETKAVDALAVAHSVQLVNYLSISKIDLGILLNFGPKKLEFKTKTRSYSSNTEPPNLLQ